MLEFSSTEKPLTTLKSGNGYWIKASQATTINIMGDTPYQLPTLSGLDGWKMLGSVNVDDVSAFFTQNPTVTIVWTFKDDQWYSIPKDSSINSSLAEDNNISELLSIEPTQGFDGKIKKGKKWQETRLLQSCNLNLHSIICKIRW